MIARGASGAINVRGVPTELRERFRILCLVRGTTMTDRMVELIEADVAMGATEFEALRPKREEPRKPELVGTP